MSTANGRSFPPPLFFLLGILTAVALFGLGVGAFWVFDRYQSEQAASDGVGGLYEEAWRILEDDFLGDLPPAEERAYGAIKGSVESVDDPYTFFVEPEPAQREQERLEGKFGGIGAYLRPGEDGRIRLDPMVGRPAAVSGVLKDDILAVVNGELLPVPADVDQVTALLRGPVGETVTISVLRNSQELEFAIKRAEIDLPSVTYRIIDSLPADIATPATPVGVVRIERFSGLTEAELAQALQALRDAGALQHVVLDLRGNPGGLLDAGVAVADHFLDGGLVMIERQADGGEKAYNATPGGDATQSRIVVLVDEGTASAAEIVAGALQDRQRGLLVGARTYGKGSVQHVHRLSDNSALHVTFARWYTPGGRQIDGKGLIPDIVVDTENVAASEGSDPVLDAGLKALLHSIVS